MPLVALVRKLLRSPLCCIDELIVRRAMAPPVINTAPAAAAITVSERLKPPCPWRVRLS